MRSKNNDWKGEWRGHPSIVLALAFSCLFVCPAMPMFRSAIRFRLVLGIRFVCHKLESMKTNDWMQRQYTPFLSIRFRWNETLGVQMTGTLVRQLISMTCGSSREEPELSEMVGTTFMDFSKLFVNHRAFHYESARGWQSSVSLDEAPSYLESYTVDEDSVERKLKIQKTLVQRQMMTLISQKCSSLYLAPLLKCSTTLIKSAIGRIASRHVGHVPWYIGAERLFLMCSCKTRCKWSCWVLLLVNLKEWD